MYRTCKNSAITAVHNRGRDPAGLRASSAKQRRLDALDGNRWECLASILITRKVDTSRARLPKKLTFEPGDYV